MSGFKFCVVAAAVVCAASMGAQADPAPIEPVLVSYPALETPVFPPLTDLAPAVDAVPSTIGASPATSTAIPLPAGVYVGLVGLASAAIARRRYLKRR